MGAPARTREDVQPAVAARVDEFVRRLKNQTDLPPVSQVILFGSYARGDHHADSDVDIGVVFQTNERDGLIAHLAQIAIEMRDCTLSPKVLIENDFAEIHHRARPAFYRNIAREGIEWNLQ